MERHIQGAALIYAFNRRKGPGSASGPLNSIPKERGRNRYGSFEELSGKAEDQPGTLGVEVHTKTKVTQMEKN
jgi:hypothetical protein